MCSRFTSPLCAISIPTVSELGAIIAAASKVVQDPAYGSKILSSPFILAMLLRTYAAMGSSGVLVIQIRSAGAIEEVCKRMLGLSY